MFPSLYDRLACPLTFFSTQQGVEDQHVRYYFYQYRIYCIAPKVDT